MIQSCKKSTARSENDRQIFAREVTNTSAMTMEIVSKRFEIIEWPNQWIWSD